MKVYKNILLEKERLEILNFVKTTVKDLGPDFPGLQSSPDLHQYKELKILIDKIKDIIDGYSIQKCWANLSHGDFIYWHKHDASDKSIVYYLKSPKNLGVMFAKNKSGIEYTEGVENSLVMFDGSKEHSVPNSHKKMDRYTIALDII